MTSQHRKTKKVKSRKATPAARSRIPTDASPDKKIALLTRERDEALERETATSEVLQIISNSPTDLQSALGAIAESAVAIYWPYGSHWSLGECPSSVGLC